ncbi:glutamate ABC transporter substrate-binding protein [Agrococcus jejuensis]|uniref:Amino acid ABC transporter substrate-binding protein, PAAT family n=1 Tax=Agrococcus jejuensis TaxID=399736 RepID=A0A1G8AL93_9MICO|nr:glutamate ABC transporter substrate-binding protein [Agrococcus jejuensis]SDH21623.1 amino acid ABC transporter substrate-binding protein, PAAT family [Agrococcus jejuensis]
MKLSSLSKIGVVGAAALLALTACNSGAPTADPDAEPGAEGSSTPWEVATDVDLTGSPTYDAMMEDGVITIGVKEDQPGLGYLDAVTGERTGFDVDIARWIAASLGFDEEDIEFVAIPSANREQALVNGDIDIYVGTYSITDARKQQIDFAGPYFITGQGILVGADSDIASEADLSADTTVCSATGSTPIQNIRDNYPEVPVQEFDTYSQCVDALRNGTVDAVTTDQAILLGYAALYSDEIQVVGEPFTEERYGVGLPLGDDALRTWINDLFEDGGDTWTAIYDNNLGATGIEVEQPEVDRY